MYRLLLQQLAQTLLKGKQLWLILAVAAALDVLGSLGVGGPALVSLGESVLDTACSNRSVQVTPVRTYTLTPDDMSLQPFENK